MIIGLGHRAQTGKDTIADRLVRVHGFKRLAFADALKAVMLDLNPVIPAGREWRVADEVKISGWEGAKKVQEVRALLQRLGVAARAHMGEDVWVNVVLNQITDTEDFVVTDVRFPNEYLALQRAGAHMVRVIRSAAPELDHISETALSDVRWPTTIVNNLDKEDLYRKVDALVTSLDSIAHPV